MQIMYLCMLLYLFIIRMQSYRVHLTLRQHKDINVQDHSVHQITDHEYYFTIVYIKNYTLTVNC
jgi:hypothetical protein